MRCLAAVFAMTVFAVAAHGEDAGVNLVRNGSFEAGADHWALAGPGVSIVENDAHEGAKCLRIERAMTDPEQTAVHRGITVQAGARYRLRAMAKLPQAGRCTYKVTVDWVDGRGRHLSYANDWNGQAAGEGWQLHEAEVTAPEGAAGASLLIGISAGALMHFDDLSFALIPPTLVIDALGLADPVWREGEPNEIRCRIRNAGGLPVEGASGVLSAGDQEFAVGVGALAVGEERLLSAELPPLEGSHSQLRLKAEFASQNADPAASSSIMDLSQTVRLDQVAGKMPGVIRAMGAAITDKAGDAQRVETKIEPNGEGWFRLKATLTATKPIEVSHFSLIDLFVDFGEEPGAKDSALFAGLEYLTPEELSSGTDSVARDLSDRYVPHPNKVTTPIMAVAKDGVAVGLAWNPLQEWMPGHDRPAAIFASPDRFHLSDGHFMSLAAPGVGQYRKENGRTASTPVKLQPGQSISIEAELFVLPIKRDVSEVMTAWYARHGVAPLPEIEQDYARHWRDAVNYSMGTWDATMKGWKAEAHHEARFQPHIAAQLLNYATWNENAVAEKARSQALEAIDAQMEKHGPGSLGLELALRAGRVRENLGHLQSGTHLLDTQQPDGSWPFVPNETTKGLGATGDTASGICLQPTTQLFQLAERTGSERALAAALKGLDYVERTFNRPAGGETWEVPLHAPNLKAAAMGIDCGVLAYRLTGDEKYLDIARYWATTGLPFVYTWEAADRPGMRYATTSVFGATFYTCIWFGRPVQWVGIVYARSLDQLAKIDKGFDWTAIADGILLSAIHQQRLALEPDAGNPWPGAVPDSYELTGGVVLGAWIGPHLLMENLENRNGAPRMDARLLGTPGQQIRVLSGTPIEAAHRAGDAVHLKLRYPEDAPVHTLLLCTTKPSAVTLNGDALPQARDPDAADTGWWHDSDRHVTVIKHTGPEERQLTIQGVGFVPSQP